MTRRRRLWAASAVFAAMLVLAGAAFGLTTGELEPRANEWQGKTCTAALLKSTLAKANERIALCYALNRAQEDKTTIAALQSQVMKLEASQVPAAKEVTFFTKLTQGNVTATSPAIDGKGYSHLTYSTNAAVAGGGVFIELSNDGATWYKEDSGTVCPGNANIGLVCELAARYVRMVVVGPTSSFTATGVLSN